MVPPAASSLPQPAQMNSALNSTRATRVAVLSTGICASLEVLIPTSFLFFPLSRYLG
jgi:hypothetical protein